MFSSPQFGEVIAMPRGSVLRIANALPTLNGSAVVCIAENALGHAEATARLFVYQNEESKTSLDKEIGVDVQLILVVRG